MEILFLLGLIALNGLFAMSEIAIVTARKSRLLALATNGRPAAATALQLAENPTQFLSTIQIGITSIGIMSGILGEAALADPIALWLQELMGWSKKTSISAATFVVIIFVTYLSIVAGELLPKRIGQISPERIACVVALPMRRLARSMRPVVFVLAASTNILMKVLGIVVNKGQSVTEDDIHALLQEGSASGVIEQAEHQMLKNVLRLDDRPITSLMVPRPDVVFLDTSLSLEENYQRVITAPHSIFPLCHQNFENVLGVVKIKILFTALISGDQIDLAELAQEAKFMLENCSALELLEYFKSSGDDMVFVVDEYGHVPGIITMYDLVEVMAGEFNTEHSDAYIVIREDGSLLLDGLLPVLDLKECLELKQLPNEGEYQTLNGLMLKLADRVPVVGEKVSLQGWLLEVIDIDGHRVDKVLAKKLIE